MFIATVIRSKDHFSGKNYEHRRQWIEDRLLELGSIFSIDIAAYAIMSNHYHVVLHVDKQQADGWSNKEICKRWAVRITVAMNTKFYEA